MALWPWKRKKEEPPARPLRSGRKSVLEMTEEELAAYYKSQGWPPPAKGKDYRVW